MSCLSDDAAPGSTCLSDDAAPSSTQPPRSSAVTPVAQPRVIKSNNTTPKNTGKPKAPPQSPVSVDDVGLIDVAAQLGDLEEARLQTCDVVKPAAPNAMKHTFSKRGALTCMGVVAIVVVLITAACRDGASSPYTASVMTMTDHAIKPNATTHVRGVSALKALPRHVKRVTTRLSRRAARVEAEVEGVILGNGQAVQTLQGLVLILAMCVGFLELEFGYFDSSPCVK